MQTTLQVYVDKQTIMVGETVTITIKNNGQRSLTFPDSALGLQIQNLDTGEISGLIAEQVITELSPNASKMIQWEIPIGTPRGSYIAKVSSMAAAGAPVLTAVANFRVT